MGHLCTAREAGQLAGEDFVIQPTGGRSQQKHGVSMGPDEISCGI